MPPTAPSLGPDPLRVLVAAPCEADAHRMVDALRAEGVAVESRDASSRADLEAALAEPGWDLVLWDDRVGGLGVGEALERVRGQSADLPFLVVAEAGTETAALAALRAGAQDYVLRDALARLGPAALREVSNARDRAQHRGAERILRQANDTLEALVQASPLGVVVVDARGCVLAWNPAAEALFGWTTEEVLGRPLPIVADEQRGEFLALLARQVAGEALRGVELVRWRKDGSRIEVALWSSPLADVDGRGIGVIGLFADNRERRAAERELLAHRRQLQRLASELSLTQEREQRRIAVELHDGIGQTLAYAKMRLRALQTSAPDLGQRLTPVEELLDEAIRGTRELTAEISCEALYRLGLVPALRVLCDRVERKSGFSCEVRADGLMPELAEDEKILVYQTVRELVANAVKHSGGTALRVALEVSAAEIRVVVADDGAGFAFDPPRAVLAASGGFGLFSLQERWGRLGGCVTAGRQRGGGARVAVSAPRRGAGANPPEGEGWV